MKRLEAPSADLGKKRLRLIADEDDDDEDYEQIETNVKRQRVEPEPVKQTEPAENPSNQLEIS